MEFQVTVNADLPPTKMIAEVGRGFRDALKRTSVRFAEAYLQGDAQAALESIADDGNGQLTFVYSLRRRRL